MPNHLYFAVKTCQPKSRRFFLLMAFVFLLTIENYGQAPACNTITRQMNYTIKSVKISGRWVSKDLQARVEETAGLGKIFDPANVSLAMNLVKNEINNNEAGFSIRLLGATSVLYVTAFSCPVDINAQQKEVEVIIKPYYLRIDLYNIGNNMLPIPRTAKPTFYKQVPALILATSPLVSFFNDNRTGTSLNLQTKTDLLHLGSIKKSEDTSTINRLDLSLNILKSVTQQFYNLSTSIQYTHPVYNDKGIGWSVGGIYAKQNQPLLSNENQTNFVKIFASVNGSGKTPLVNKYQAGTGVLFSENNYNQQVGKFQQKERVYNFYAIADGRIAKGFSRLALWFNAAIPKGNNAVNYQQIAGRFGYAVPLGYGHNKPELETTFSLGYSFKTPLPFSTYFAGNTAGNFLYTNLQSFNNAAFPEGPVIRSLGEKSGGLPASLNTSIGGTSFWGLNLNFSIPIPKWSQPLIPNILISDEPRITMRSALKGQVNTALNSIADDLAENHGLSDDEADAAATKIVDKDIRPTIKYLADRANVFSVRPLVLLDIGEVYYRKLSSRLWTAAGAGIQLNIVNARLEMGYIHTVHPKTDADRGNFLVKFSVQNFY